MKKICIIDYGAGNVKSVINAFEEVEKNIEIILSNKEADIKKSDFLVLPGVGAFEDCMNSLKNVSELIPNLNEAVLTNKKPFLGVCVGMQVLATLGQENGTHKGLNYIAGEVKKIPNIDVNNNVLKVPHMGWNNVFIKENNNHPILAGIENGEHFYFANSYYFQGENEENILAFAQYGVKISAVISKENIFATQFHPEKSGKSGLKIFKNFLNS
jgi:glutamine amidotransferase